MLSVGWCRRLEPREPGLMTILLLAAVMSTAKLLSELETMLLVLATLLLLV